MRYQDGRAWIIGCPRCSRPIVEAHIDGLKWRVSRHAVPYKDAVVLSKYLRPVLNIWAGINVIYATGWFYTSGRPSKGHLFVTHHCGAWN